MEDVAGAALYLGGLWAASRYHAKPSSWLATAVSVSCSSVLCFDLAGAVAIAGAAARWGAAAAWFELGSVVCTALVLGFVVLPVLVRARAGSVLEYLGVRYGKQVQLGAAVLVLGIGALGRVATGLVAVHRLFVEEDKWWGAVVAAGVLVLAAVSSRLSSTAAETLQLVAALASAGVVAACALRGVGGFSAMLTAASSLAANNQTTHEFSTLMLRKWDDPVQPWPAALTGYYAFAVWAWALDDSVVVRALGAKDVNHGAAACLAAALLKLAAFAALVVVGVCGRILMTEINTSHVSYDGVYGLVVRSTVPAGVRGAVVAVLLAGQALSLRRAVRDAGDVAARMGWQQQHTHSKAQAAVLALGAAWFVRLATLARTAPSLLALVQTPLALLAPPVTVVCLGGMLSARPTERGAETALLAGAALGLGRLVEQMAVMVVAGGGRHHVHMGTNAYFAALQSAVCCVVLFVASEDKDELAAVALRQETLVWRFTIRREITHPEQFRRRYEVLVNEHTFELEPVGQGDSPDSSSSSDAEDEPATAPAEDGDFVLIPCCRRVCTIRRSRVEHFLHFLLGTVLLRWFSLALLVQYGLYVH